MTQVILIDEFHLAVYARSPASVSQNNVIAKTLSRRGFQSDLHRAIRNVIRQHRLSRNVSFVITR